MKAAVIQIVQWRADNIWVIRSETYRNCMESEDLQIFPWAQTVLVCVGKRYVKIVCSQIVFGLFSNAMTCLWGFCQKRTDII
jgi:hypothetical protein